MHPARRDLRVAAATILAMVAVGGLWGAYVLTRPQAVTSGGGTADQYASSPSESHAQRILVDILAGQPRGAPKAAAYVQTTYAQFAESQPGSAGSPSSHGPTDVVVIVEVEGWFPAAHSAPAGASGDATEILAPYDVTTGVGLPWTFAFNPASPDIPGAPASVSGERFALLSHYAAPTALALP